MTSATVFTAVKLAGAAYLVWVGLRRLLLRLDTAGASTGPAFTAMGRGSAFLQGVVVNVLNPKTALFFLAFLPQFADAARGPVAPQVAVLGVLLATLGVLSDGTYALVAGSASDWLRRNPRFVRAGDRAAGGVYVTLGVAAALARRPAMP
jgi:threonine/homoserine/homoserine lactone efflux protein